MDTKIATLGHNYIVMLNLTKAFLNFNGFIDRSLLTVSRMPKKENGLDQHDNARNAYPLSEIIERFWLIIYHPQWELFFKRHFFHPSQMTWTTWCPAKELQWFEMTSVQQAFYWVNISGIFRWILTKIVRPAEKEICRVYNRSKFAKNLSALLFKYQSHRKMPIVSTILNSAARKSLLTTVASWYHWQMEFRPPYQLCNLYSCNNEKVTNCKDFIKKPLLTDQNSFKSK